MKHPYFWLLLPLLSWGSPARAQLSKFHGGLGAGVVQLHAVTQSTTPNNTGLVTTDANLALVSLNLGFDAPLYQFGDGEQSLGISLNVAGGLMGTTRTDVDGLNAQFIVDLPQYATYRYGAKATKNSQKDFGLGLGLGYRFCQFILPFNSPSAMLEGVYATTRTDYFLRFSADLRPTTFYSPDPGGGPTEEIRIREFQVLLGYSF